MEFETRQKGIVYSPVSSGKNICFASIHQVGERRRDDKTLLPNQLST